MNIASNLRTFDGLLVISEMADPGYCEEIIVSERELARMTDAELIDLFTRSGRRVTHTRIHRATMLAGAVSERDLLARTGRHEHQAARRTHAQIRMAVQARLKKAEAAARLFRRTLAA